MSKYTTVQGDTWDIIALKTLGREQYMNLIIDANHQYREIVIFPANYSIVIPSVAIPTPDVLPPWKRRPI